MEAETIPYPYLMLKKCLLMNCGCGRLGIQKPKRSLQLSFSQSVSQFYGQPFQNVKSQSLSRFNELPEVLDQIGASSLFLGSNGETSQNTSISKLQTSTCPPSGWKTGPGFPVYPCPLSQAPLWAWLEPFLLPTLQQIRVLADESEKCHPIGQKKMLKQIPSVLTEMLYVTGTALPCCERVLPVSGCQVAPA